MEHAAAFRFFGSLNDFFSETDKNSFISYRFNGFPSIKDAIEAMGVPHTEVDVIVANGSFVNFGYRLNNGDKAEVYPLKNIADVSINLLTPRPVYPLHFVADVHAGKLAKALRMLGLDTVYKNNATNTYITDIAAQEHRIVLTRDVGLLKHSRIKWGHWLRSQHPDEQLHEVTERFDLASAIAPFIRCIECNGLIEPVKKEQILNMLPPKTVQYFDEFYQCVDCKKIYWKGSHYQHMLEKIKKITGSKT